MAPFDGLVIGLYNLVLSVHFSLSYFSLLSRQAVLLKWAIIPVSKRIDTFVSRLSFVLI